MNEVKTLIDALTNKEKLVAMLAPSFPIVYSYPSIITRLKKLGFAYTVEVAVGAKKTNEELVELLKENPKARYITTPCPTIVRMVKKQMPQYAKYFTHGVDSPMVATAKIIREQYPGYRPVFIGPCFVKKLEAQEDHPEMNILIITFTELTKLFAYFNISDATDNNDHFDIAEPGLTRMYALDGGLSHSSGLTSQFQKGEVQTVSGWKNCVQAIQDFDTNPTIRVLDILNCEGGCIGGPGIQSSLTTEERKKKITDYMSSISS